MATVSGRIKNKCCSALPSIRLLFFSGRFRVTENWLFIEKLSDENVVYYLLQYLAVLLVDLFSWTQAKGKLCILY